MSYLYSKKALDFGEYGDFIFTGVGLKRIESMEGTLYQAMYKYIKSNKGDYELNQFYAANLQEHIGKGIDLRFSKFITDKLEDDLVREGLIPKQAVEIYSLIEGSILHIRIILFGRDDYTISVQIGNNGVIVN